MDALSIVGSSRSNGDRDVNDFYPTPDYATIELIKREQFNGKTIECACGDGAISKILINNGIDTDSIDIIDRGFGDVMDFFTMTKQYDNVVTNPPYSKALDFILHAKKIAKSKIAMLLKTVFLESSSRYGMFTDKSFPLKCIYQFCKRLSLYKNGVKMKNSGMISYAWYVWDKQYTGEPMIRWIKQRGEGCGVGCGEGCAS